MSVTRRQLLAAPFAFREQAGTPAGGTLLWDWFMKQLDEADARRRDRLKALRTPAAVAALRSRVRAKLLQAIGGLPERTPLRARRTGELRRPGYVIEKIIFESRPGFYVTANVYRPERAAGPRPAVLQSCGHYMEGKAAADYQTACAAFALKGVIAMVFDPAGQGERRMLRGVAGLGQGATAEHVAAGAPSYLVGRTFAQFRIWDAVRALDYLESRPDVNPTRLGMFGHSGGGMMTLLTAPLDGRVRAAMSCCAVTSFYHKTRALLIADPEQIVPGVYRDGIDHPELIAAVAPRAFLIGAAKRDYVPLDGTRRTFAEVQPVFERAGHPGRVALVETDDEHRFNRELREACYGWMLQHLAGAAGDAREPELAPESEADLRAAPTGCVMDIAGARGVFEINRDEARYLATRRRPADLSRLLALPAKVEPEIPLPSLVTGAGDNMIVLVGPGRNAALARELAASGCAVMELDLRGWGETTPDLAGGKVSFRVDDFFAYRAIEMGRPLAGMRVLDLLAAVAGARARYRRVFVAGIRQGGVVALHAAAVDEGIAGVAAVGSLGSYQEMVERPVHTEPVASVVPGALLHYDLPELAGRIRPRPCVVLREAAARAILEGLRLL